jgi:hypothetical protein
MEKPVGEKRKQAQYEPGERSVNCQQQPAPATPSDCAKPDSYHQSTRRAYRCSDHGTHQGKRTKRHDAKAVESASTNNEKQSRY